MATPTTRSLELPGPEGPERPDGGAVSIQVTSAAGWRPVIVLVGEARACTPFVERLSTAGFATVACDPRSPADLTIVLEALERGALGVDAVSYSVLQFAADGSAVLSRVRAGERPANPLDGVPVLAVGVDAMCRWLLRELR